VLLLMTVVLDGSLACMSWTARGNGKVAGSLWQTQYLP
jgi:hypothetical protein